jgi:hypothetical protein
MAPNPPPILPLGLQPNILSVPAGTDKPSNITQSKDCADEFGRSEYKGLRASLIKSGKAVQHHFLNHVGAGLVASVAYFDPGNWSVDLQAGSQFGYKMLFVVMLSNVVAVVLQVRRNLFSKKRPR